MSDQYHTPAALALGKEPVHIAYQAGWVPDAGRTFWKTEKSLALKGFELLIVQTVT